MSEYLEEEARYERNRQNPPKPRDLDPVYVKHYNRGWAASSREGIDVLGAADWRGEPDAWYDGYFDRAIEDKKWIRVPDSARLQIN